MLHDGRILSVYYEQPGPLTPIRLTLYNVTTWDTLELPAPTGYRFLAKPVVLNDDRILLFGAYPGNAEGSPLAREDETTAELFSFGDPGLPPGCCPPTS